MEDNDFYAPGVSSLVIETQRTHEKQQNNDLLPSQQNKPNLRQQIPLWLMWKHTRQHSFKWQMMKYNVKMT